MTNYKGQWVQAIKVNGVPNGMIGQIRSIGPEGQFYVAWENGMIGVIRERGDTYRLIDVPQKKFWNIKNLLLTLLNKFKS